MTYLQERMFNIIKQHVNSDAIFAYDHVKNTVTYSWEVRNKKGVATYREGGKCNLNVWFDEQDHGKVIDMIMPKL